MLFRSLMPSQRFVIASTSASGIAKGGLVFGGDGWYVKAKGRDPFANLDVTGKIVLYYKGSTRPADVTTKDITGKLGEDWDTPVTYAARKGAAGVVFLPGGEYRESWNFFRRFVAGTQLSPTKFRPAEQQSASIPVIYASPEFAEELLKEEPTTVLRLEKDISDSKPQRSFELSKEKSLTLNVIMKREIATTQNVVGILEGSDDRLKSEFVGVSAHIDHLGRTAGDKGDIYNGADDDGSGTVGVLSLAEAFSHSRHHPKRSLIFIWHTGEESGLWGSRYMTHYPTFPFQSLTSLINIDMIGRSKHDGDTNPRNKNLTTENEIYVIGSTMMSTELGDICRQVNEKYLKLSYNFKYDAPGDPERLFFRSDHYNYAVAGVPILFYFDGVHEDYHRVTDKADKIDYTKMEKITRTIYKTLVEIGNRRNRVVVDKKLQKAFSNEGD